MSKLAVMSKEADNIVKGCRHWENITMNNEAEIEDTDKATRNAKKIGKMRIFLVQMMHDFSSDRSSRSSTFVRQGVHLLVTLVIVVYSTQS